MEGFQVMAKEERPGHTKGSPDCHQGSSHLQNKGHCHRTEQLRVMLRTGKETPRAPGHVKRHLKFLEQKETIMG